DDYFINWLARCVSLGTGVSTGTVGIDCGYSRRLDSKKCGRGTRCAYWKLDVGACGCCLDFGLVSRVTLLKKDNFNAQEDTEDRDRDFFLYVVFWHRVLRSSRGAAESCAYWGRTSYSNSERSETTISRQEEGTRRSPKGDTQSDL